MASITTVGNHDTGAALSGAVGDRATHFSVWNSGSGGTLLGTGALTGTTPPALALGDSIRINNGTKIISLPPASGQTQEYAARLLDGMRATAIYVQYHTGLPGTNGTDNDIPPTDFAGGQNRIALAPGSMTVNRTTD